MCYFEKRDATVRGLAVNQDAVRDMFEEICGISLNADISFSVRRTEAIPAGGNPPTWNGLDARLRGQDESGDKY